MKLTITVCDENKLSNLIIVVEPLSGMYRSSVYNGEISDFKLLDRAMGSDFDSMLRYAIREANSRRYGYRGVTHGIALAGMSTLRGA